LYLSTKKVFAAGENLSLSGNSGLNLVRYRACHPGAADEKSPAAAMQAGLFAGLRSRED